MNSGSLRARRSRLCGAPEPGARESGRREPGCVTPAASQSQPHLSGAWPRGRGTKRKPHLLRRQPCLPPGRQDELHGTGTAREGGSCSSSIGRATEPTAPPGARVQLRGRVLERGHQEKALPAPVPATSASWAEGRAPGARDSQLQPPEQPRR
ncbi:hypothetical protein NDU88_004496 [Pleurodeles waltl]|uniref:Uncharacterized protein n=1 Tax=Pleurodeles waltl TaxID=8319 RepID=A0AAV7RFV8_PLEWA|nr:hypothetical protein NDU88_004496 [Pleurodeles waltl]